MRAAIKSMALTLAVLAMMLRAAVPEGWMPARAGQAPLTPCPGMMAMAPTPHPLSPLQDHKGHATLCIFAAAGPLASAPIPAMAQAPSTPFHLAQAITDLAGPAAEATYRLNAARAPPRLA